MKLSKEVLVSAAMLAFLPAVAVDGVKSGGYCGRIGDSATMLYLGNSPNGATPFKGGIANLEISHGR